MTSIGYISGQRSDAIFREIRGEMKHHGFTERDTNQADIVIISAGDPFWADPGHSDARVNEILAREGQKVVIIERHEYGWPNYASAENRRHTAHLGVEEYGLGIEAGGQCPHKEGWHRPLSRLVREISKSRLLYFRREFYEGYDYPEWIRPTNFPLGPSPAKFSHESFVARPLDLMCVWGETHPHRKIIADALRGAVAEGWLKADIRSPVYNGDAGRLPGGDGYRKPHERACIFVTSDGHGLGGGREWELLTTSVMLRKRSWMKFPHDFVHGETCLLFGDPLNPDPVGLLDLLRRMIQDRDRLYEIYSRAYDHATEFHTTYARCQDIVAAMKEKRWI